MRELAKNIEFGLQKKISYLKSDGVKLSLHSWVPVCTKAVLFYISGIQSHAGWLWETGPALAEQNIAVFSLDRRGSGLSEGLRGDIPSADILLNDYWCALKNIKQQFKDQPLTLLGQSLGGAILAALVSNSKFNLQYDAVIFCASGLGRQHQQLSTADYEKTRANRSLELKSINLSDEDMTDDPKYLSFMKNDSLRFMQMTHRAQASLLDLENLYWDKSNIFGDNPAVFVAPKFDPIVDLNAALSIFRNLSGNKGQVLELPTSKHYLWFTKVRHLLLPWLANYILMAGCYSQ